MQELEKEILDWGQALLRLKVYNNDDNMTMMTMILELAKTMTLTFLTILTIDHFTVVARLPSQRMEERLPVTLL